MTEIGSPTMKIVVCVKQVPDTWAEKRLSDSDHALDRAGVDAVMNEIDEYAVEEALRLVESQGGEVTILSMGPEKAGETIRKALSMGADAAIHICDDALHGSDAFATATTIAAALRGREFDLVILGSESTDARMSVVPALVAEYLELPQLTFAGRLEVSGTTARNERVAEYGYDVVEVTTPAIVSVVEKINEPRYPSFKGIMAAKKKPVETLDLAALGVDPASVGFSGARSGVDSYSLRPARSAGVVVTDDGTGGQQVAEFLASQKFI